MDDQQMAADLDGPFTIDEIIEIEALTGKSITDLRTGHCGHTLRVVAWVVGRRTDPTFTLADAGVMWVKLDG